MIAVGVFQPFNSRMGVDTVVALRFAYRAQLVDVLKAALATAKQFYAHGQPAHKQCPGGWLAPHKVWFVERWAWPVVRDHLHRAGYLLDGEPEPENAPRAVPPRPPAPPAPPAPPPPPPGPGCVQCARLPAVLEEWAWEMRTRWSDDAAPVIEAGHTLLREMLLAAAEN